MCRKKLNQNKTDKTAKINEILQIQIQEKYKSCFINLKSDF